jgi:DNA-binding NarL/FixJ family response regulator
MSQIRILIADDHEIVRQGLRSLLEAQPGWVVCGEAATGREAVAKAKELRPDVAIIDLTMPELNGLQATHQILKAVLGVEVLILTMHESDEAIRKAFEAGARGYVLKTDAGRELVAAVEALSHHKPFFTSRVAERVLVGYLRDNGRAATFEPSRSPLTAREKEIVQLLAEGKSNKAVASELNITINTVEAHRSNVMHKLGFKSLSDLVRYAIRNLIIQP